MKSFLIILLFTLPGLVSLQEAIGQRVENPAFDKKIDGLIGYRVPVKTVSQIYEDTLSSYIFLDAREPEEYRVSHLPGARHVGYDDFDISSVSDISKDTRIIVYCSIGYRSDRIGGKMKKAGFNNVYNLYGSIFEWVNQGLPVIDSTGHHTSRIHTYNKKWSKWVDNPEIQKVW